MRRLAVLLIVFLFVACGSHKSPIKAPVRVAPSIQTADESSLDKTLRELKAYPCPAGVDEELWTELKDALGKALNCRARTRGAPLGENAKMVDGGAQVPALQLSLLLPTSHFLHPAKAFIMAPPCMRRVTLSYSSPS